MKTFRIIYARSIKEDVVIKAKNQAEALKKFRQEKPEVRVLDVHDGPDLEMAVYG